MVLSPKDRLIFPLDVPDVREARRLIELLKDEVGLFKIGLQLFTGEGLRAVGQIASERPTGIFLDLKIFDISNTVSSAARQLHGMEIAFLTFPADQGRAALESVVKNRPIPGSKVLAVTVLTSLDEEGMREVGMSKSVQEVVLLRAELARDAGCDGVVCSGLEARAVRERMGPKFIVVCPGIRPSWYREPDDQRRVTTPSEAIRNGADYVVVGRPIRLAKDPADAARRVVSEIAEALQ